MKSIIYIRLLVALVFMFTNAYASAAGTGGIAVSPLSLESIASNSKLSTHGNILAPFEEGKATISVVVSLRTTSESQAISARSMEMNGIEATNSNSGSSPTDGPYYDLSNVDIRTDLAKAVKRELDDFLTATTQINSANIVTNADASGVTAPIIVTNRFTYSFGFAANVTLSGLNYLLQNDKVLLIEENLVLKPNMTQGLSVMNGETARSTYTGIGVAVAVADTGIDDSHPDLNGGKVLGGFDFGEDDSGYQPTSGASASAHGTSVAGIVAGDVNTQGDYIGGVAPGAKLYGLKISNDTDFRASSADMVDAWEWAITHKNDDPNNPILIVNTSFGGNRFTSSCNATNSSMTQAALNGVNAGISHFVSSGNDGYCDAMGWPACITHVNSVGAVYDANIGTQGWCVSTDSCLATSPNTGCSAGSEAFFDSSTAADQVTAYSNSDTNLTIFAPSNNASTTDIVGSGGSSSGNYTTNFGGTSAAAPYSAGAAAVLQSAAMEKLGRFLTPAEVTAALVSTGSSITDSKASLTKPRVDLNAAVASVPEEYPDLITEAPAVSNTTPNIGQSFTVSVTVRNNGAAASAATTLRYFRSTNSFISTADVEIATDAVAGLSAGATSVQNAAVSIADAGTFWIGACVDSVDRESNINNQCTTSPIQVVVSAQAPNLTVESPSVDNSTPFEGQAFTITATVRNSGGAASTATTLRYFRSTNNIISTGDVEIASDAVGSLSAGATSGQNETVSVADAGTFWVGACVDIVPGEVLQSDQCTSGVQVDVAPSGPDLIVADFAVDNAAPTVGESITLFASVFNQGMGDAQASSLRYFLSDDATIDAGDTLILDIPTPVLPGDNSFDDELIITFGGVGTGFLGACVDSVAGETNTGNQCSGGVQVVVAPAITPDAFEPDDTPETAKSISNQAPQAHNFHVSGDVDWLSFTLSSEITDLVIETSSSQPGDTIIGLFDDSGELVVSDDDGGENLYSRIELASLAAGQYFISTQEFNSLRTLEDYSISLSYTGDEDSILDFLPAIISAASSGAASKSCGQDAVPDCSGKCIDADTANSRIGNGLCDDAQSDINLLCSAFQNDGNDCSN